MEQFSPSLNQRHLSFINALFKLVTVRLEKGGKVECSPSVLRFGSRMILHNNPCLGVPAL
jgi:hypothetical protein